MVFTVLGAVAEALAVPSAAGSLDCAQAQAGTASAINKARRTAVDMSQRKKPDPCRIVNPLIMNFDINAISARVRTRTLRVSWPITSTRLIARPGRPSVGHPNVAGTQQEWRPLDSQR